MGGPLEKGPAAWFRAAFPGQSAVVASAHFHHHLAVGLACCVLGLAFWKWLAVGAIAAGALVVVAEYRKGSYIDWWTRGAGWALGAVIAALILVLS